MKTNTWLQDNIVPLIAILYTVFSFTIYTLVLVHAISATENVAFLIINSITNVVMLIVGYYFGSSAGSKAKQGAIDKMVELTPKKPENEVA